MTAIEPIFDYASMDLNHVIADRDQLRAVNPQRFEMEQLTAIVHDDPREQICFGYKDVAADEFWARGYLPGNPRMPEVLVCEAAGQMCSYYVQKHGVAQGKLGFAGMNDVQFERPVFAGDRLLMLGKVLKARAGMMVVWKFQAFVNRELVSDGTIRGVVLPAALFAGQP